MTIRLNAKFSERQLRLIKDEADRHAKFADPPDAASWKAIAKQCARQLTYYPKKRQEKKAVAP
jgi:hypothetical protein